MVLRACHFYILLFLTIFGATWATFGYYKMFTPYGTGDTMIASWGGHRGAITPHKKWIVECMDGEAMVGVLGNGDDYTRLWFLWCKFMFPYKPPAQGAYPYYPSCHVRNMTTQYFCYHSQEHEKTVNTFITGYYSVQWNFIISRLTLDNLSLYKCCKTPNGYYLDYTACYYQPTHDPYWEYYDTNGVIGHFLVYCATGYVMTGITKRVNPYTHPDYHVDWIQCCRIGFGIKPHQPPPGNNTNYAYSGNTVKTYSYARSRSLAGNPNSRSIVELARSRLEQDDHDTTNDLNGWRQLGSPELDYYTSLNNSDHVSGQVNSFFSLSSPSVFSPTNL